MGVSSQQIDHGGLHTPPNCYKPTVLGNCVGQQFALDFASVCDKNPDRHLVLSTNGQNPSLRTDSTSSIRLLSALDKRFGSHAQSRTPACAKRDACPTFRRLSLLRLTNGRSCHK